MVEQGPSKPPMRVRFPSPAPLEDGLQFEETARPSCRRNAGFLGAARVRLPPSTPFSHLWRRAPWGQPKAYLAQLWPFGHLQQARSLTKNPVGLYSSAGIHFARSVRKIVGKFSRYPVFPSATGNYYAMNRRNGWLNGFELF